MNRRGARYIAVVDTPSAHRKYVPVRPVAADGPRTVRRPWSGWQESASLPATVHSGHGPCGPPTRPSAAQCRGGQSSDTLPWWPQREPAPAPHESAKALAGLKAGAQRKAQHATPHSAHLSLWSWVGGQRADLCITVAPQPANFRPRLTWLRPDKIWHASDQNWGGESSMGSVRLGGLLCGAPHGGAWPPAGSRERESREILAGNRRSDFDENSSGADLCSEAD